MDLDQILSVLDIPTLGAGVVLLLRRATTILAEVKAMRADLSAHAKQDDERHAGVMESMRRVWRLAGESDDR